MRPRPLLLVVALAAAFGPLAGAAPATAQSAPVVVVAAGDISPEPAATTTNDHATAALAVAADPRRVVCLGDCQYEDGDLAKFRSTRGWRGSWGRLNDRQCPTAGNHEYMDAGPGAPGFFTYFADRLTACAAAGNPSAGYYAYDLGGWRVYVLSTDCRRTDGTGPGCQAGSVQQTWLANDLARNPRACTLAISHHPRWGSGYFGDDAAVEPLWRTFVDARGDLWLAGHEHHYARFGPLDRNGHITSGAGTRQLTVGTGGKSLLGFRRSPHPEGLRYRDSSHYGVARLALTPTTWSSEFRRTDGVTADRTGTVGCWR
jgi:acid phosphatase type 7